MPRPFDVGARQRTIDVVLSVPLSGRCRVQNSPASRVPSHGTDAFGSRYAIDLVPVDGAGRSAPRTWRRLLTREPPEIFIGYGRPVLAPASGLVVQVHDGEPDHPARRSQLALVPYALGQRRRARLGAPGLAGNHVVLALTDDGPFVLLAHLQRSSLRVRTGQHVDAGTPLASCGNSGNSTEPHVHLQVSDSTDWKTARGLPFSFMRPDGRAWLPTNAEIISAQPHGPDRAGTFGSGPRRHDRARSRHDVDPSRVPFAPPPEEQ